MHISRIRATNFKRFEDLMIEIEGTPRLVVLCGPNGTGKSSLFDALHLWNYTHGGGGSFSQELDYWPRAGTTFPGAWDSFVAVEFHEDPPAGFDLKKRIYRRTAYRNDPEFEISQLQRVGPTLDAPSPGRMIENDVRVGDNYRRMVSQTIDDLYSGAHDHETVGDFRATYVQALRTALQGLFPTLVFEGLADPLAGGTFRFTKEASHDFPYKNLSGGEKAAFDLLLDLVIKREAFDDTVFCIDEPDAHMNTRVQGVLLRALVEQIGDQSQLWVATHSIGMMRTAREMQEADAGSVVFLNFGNQDFDQPVSLTPISVTRAFWKETLDVALGDLAELVAPKQVVLCEGKPAASGTSRAEFDARCFRAIFADEFPDTDFVSVGNAHEVQTDRLWLGGAIETLVAGTTVIRVIDRDQRSSQELTDLAAGGVRVLGRRHLEAYLLDDETLVALCTSVGKAALLPDVLNAKQEAHAASQGRGNDADDWKSAAGDIYNQCRHILSLVGAGSSTEAFLADTLAPLLRPGMTVRDELRDEIFGSTT